MRSRTVLLALFFISSLALPLIAYAGVPFFGPIIPRGISDIGDSQTCPLGWAGVIIVANNVISFLITLGIVFFAPLMVAWAGFLFVLNPYDPGYISKAKGILWHTVLGIVVALIGYMIVAALMAVLYNPQAVGKAWTELIGSGGQDPCIPLKGSEKPAGITPAPGVAVEPSACPVPALSPITDPLALQMEGGQTVLWTNTDPRLQTCANKFIGVAGGGSVTSAYRPQSYQAHLWEVRDRWCTQGLQSNTSSACSSLKSTISAEVSKHGLSACGAVAQSSSSHGSGTGVDIRLNNGNYSGTAQLATQSCLTWANYSSDPWHYNLISGCSCQ